jgi:hypothetical protein
MSIKQFTQKQNIEMLWDIVSDEEIFRFLPPDNQHKISQVFINNIQGFYEVEKNKTTSLVELNKKYILLILNHIKRTYPYEPSKIKIHNEQPVKELITFEEIQNDRKSQFERDFNKRQAEFEDSINVKIPSIPDFTDKDADKPIKEMDKLVKEMLAQRNYEVEQINRTYNEPDNWLKPQETSLKSEKFEPVKEKQEQQSQGNKFNFLNELSPKKNVSFSNTDQIQMFTEIEDEEDDNIFAKLKKVNVSTKEESKPVIMNDEDRISKLERNMINLNEKMDKILYLLTQKN